MCQHNDGDAEARCTRTPNRKQDTKINLSSGIPLRKTVASVCDSIVKASEKGKIKIKKVEDPHIRERGDIGTSCSRRIWTKRLMRLRLYGL